MINNGFYKITESFMADREYMKGQVVRLEYLDEHTYRIHSKGGCTGIVHMDFSGERAKHLTDTQPYTNDDNSLLKSTFTKTTEIIELEKQLEKIERYGETDASEKFALGFGAVSILLLLIGCIAVSETIACIGSIGCMLSFFDMCDFEWLNILNPVYWIRTSIENKQTRKDEAYFLKKLYDLSYENTVQRGVNEVAEETEEIIEAESEVTETPYETFQRVQREFTFGNVIEEEFHGLYLLHTVKQDTPKAS